MSGDSKAKILTPFILLLLPVSLIVFFVVLGVQYIAEKIGIEL